jgi:predicted esterase
MRILMLLLFVSMGASAEETKCMGPANGEAAHYMVFLHGSSFDMSDMRDLKALQELSQKKKIRFALPRATLPCSTEEYKGMKCWITGSPQADSHNVSMKIVEEAADICFSGKDYGVLGFSAGGMFLSVLKNYCVPNKFTRMIAMGLAMKTTKRTGDMRLDGCGPHLDLLIGDKDSHRKQVKETYANFKDRGADVSFEEYSGKHEFKAAPLLHFFD